MASDLYIHTLRQLRDGCKAERMDTETAALDVAIWAIQTQDELKKERDAAMQCTCCEYRVGDECCYTDVIAGEIIRCKDCKHYEADITANPWGMCCHDGWADWDSGHEVSENGWCYRAERRTDG